MQWPVHSLSSNITQVCMGAQVCRNLCACTDEGSEYIWKQVQLHAYTQISVTAKIERYKIEASDVSWLCVIMLKRELKQQVGFACIYTRFLLCLSL